MLRSVDMTTPETAISSGDARDAILSQHELLRALLAVTVESAGETARSGRDFETLRGHAKRLYDTLAEHMRFEELVLSAALRDVIGWGAVLQERIQEDHGRQRSALAIALSMLGPGGLSGAALIGNVRLFADTLLADMREEERFLLQADVDAITADSRGG
jgi:Hemerythrin HHE cation binding domain